MHYAQSFTHAPLASSGVELSRLKLLQGDTSFWNKAHMKQLRATQGRRKSEIIHKFTDMKYKELRGEQGALQHT
jgi:hypothetical protein